jgi:hypothetical protein
MVGPVRAVVVVVPPDAVVVVELGEPVVVVLEPARTVVEVAAPLVDEVGRVVCVVVEVEVEVVEVVEVLWGSLRAARKTPIPMASTRMNRTRTASPSDDDHTVGSGLTGSGRTGQP